MFKRLIILLVLLVATFVSAQLFDSIGGTLKDANLGSTLENGVAPTNPSTPAADLSFTPNGQRLINAEFDKLAGTLPDATPEQIDQFKQIIDQLLTAVDAEVQNLGENPHDLGTAVAAFFEFAYWSFHNLDPAKEIPDNQSLAAVKQFRALLSSNPDVVGMNNDQRQLFYEAAVGLPALFVAFQQYASDQGETATAEQWRTQLMALFKETSGLDISQVTYTDQGIVVAGAGQTTGTQTTTQQTTTQQTTTPQTTTTPAVDPMVQNQIDNMTPQQIQEMLPMCQDMVNNPAGQDQQALAVCQGIIAKTGGQTQGTQTSEANNPLNPLGGSDPFVGTFSGNNISLTLQGASNTYTGELVFNGTPFPVQATGNGTNLTGTFTSGDSTFNFTATLQDMALTLVSDGTTFNMTKQ